MLILFSSPKEQYRAFHTRALFPVCVLWDQLRSPTWHHWIIIQPFVCIFVSSFKIYYLTLRLFCNYQHLQTRRPPTQRRSSSTFRRMQLPPPPGKGLPVSLIWIVIWRFSKLFSNPPVSSFIFIWFHCDDFFHKTDPNLEGKESRESCVQLFAQAVERAPHFWARFQPEVSHLAFLSLTYALAYSLNALWWACWLHCSHAGHEIVKLQFIWVWSRL